MSCNCGASKITVPCGKEKSIKPPKCRERCANPPDCHHEARESHNCHFGECPPCKQVGELFQINFIPLLIKL